ncbi:MAG: hypothetical protein JSU98_10680 [Gemmatimonadales bacterium]|jgi:hypothetical protein|nr:MAG: hypothetical protein JSU98_10680 [Gemmatimonadales bacterium]
MRWRSAVAALLALGLVTADSAAAQHVRREASQPRFYLDLDLLGADAVGQFGELVGGGIGGQVGFRAGLGPGIPIYLRADGGVMVYGHERMDVCFPTPIGCRIGADVTTTNTVAYMGVGPEISVPGPVSPYIYGTVGFSYFSTQSSLSDDFSSEEYFNTRHYSDLVAAARMGGGARFRLGGPRSVLLDLGAEYHRNGVASYLREGDILDHPDGSITLFPNRTEANFVTFRLGVSIPLGGWDRHHEEEDWRWR